MARQRRTRNTRSAGQLESDIAKRAARIERLKKHETRAVKCAEGSLILTLLVFAIWLSRSWLLPTVDPLLDLTKNTAVEVPDLCACVPGVVEEVCRRVNASAFPPRSVEGGGPPVEDFQALPLNELWHAPRPADSPAAPKVGLFMMYSDEIAGYTAHSASLNAAYASRHGYDFMLLRSKLSYSAAGAARRDHAVTALPESKMKRMREALLSLPEETGWLLWLDADLVILRHDVTVESLIEKYGAGKDLLVSLEFSEPFANAQEADDLDARLEEARKARQAAKEAGVPDKSWKPLGVNTGALLVRRCAWSLEMLERWHGVGYRPSGDKAESAGALGQWASSEEFLTEWGAGFFKGVGKLPPDQQMHTLLQHYDRPGGFNPDNRDGGFTGDESGDESGGFRYAERVRFLPATSLNSRWPMWALDRFDSPPPPDDSFPIDEDRMPRLQFALHLFATTAEERGQALHGLHKRALCLGDPALEDLSPGELSAALAKSSLGALGARAELHPLGGFPNAELCNALYTWTGGVDLDQALRFAAQATADPPADPRALLPAGGAGTPPGAAAPRLLADLSPLAARGESEGAPAVSRPPFHPVYQVSERHRACLDPAMAGRIGEAMVARTNWDSAAAALRVAVASAHIHIAAADKVTRARAKTEAASGGPGELAVPGGLSADSVAGLRAGVSEWRALLDEAETGRRRAQSFFLERDPPGKSAKAESPVGGPGGRRRGVGQKKRRGRARQKIPVGNKQ